jgi:uracil-DNA glycosylase
MKSWSKEFLDNKVCVEKYLWNPTYDAFFKQEHIKKILEKINEQLSDIMEKENGDIEIFPYPKLIFDTFNSINLEDINLIIMGQDPYFNFSKNTDKTFKIIKNKKGKISFVPEAVGKSFSVPPSTIIPSSLKNIYKNLKKYKHFVFTPKHGDLTFWNLQGCLLLNSSLTVKYGKANSHAAYWSKLTNEFIRWISKNKEGIVFILWGNPALSKKKLIDSTKNHKIIISSHPSGLSCYKKMGDYEAFDNQDHFGIANEFLIQNKKLPIVWQVL